MINGLQIIVNLPLFDVEFPGLAHMVVVSLITIATFDVLPSNDVFEWALNPPTDEQEDSKFAEVFDSNFLILNLGTMFLMFVVLLSIPPFLFCSRPCRRCWPWFNKKHQSMKKSVQGNSWIRFIMEGSLDISICASLNYIFMRENAEGLQWGNSFEVVNSTAFIVLAILVCVFPAWALIFYCRNFEKWEDEEFEEKYGSVFEGLRKDQRSSIIYPFIFSLRRFALVVVVTIGRRLLFA